jgi:hypothetical protein
MPHRTQDTIDWVTCARQSLGERAEIEEALGLAVELDGDRDQLVTAAMTALWQGYSLRDWESVGEAYALLEIARMR